MMKSVAFRVLAALLIAAVIGVDQATAGLPGEVAHSSMGGSTLMRTTAQFGAWTHWIVEYDNFVELNVTDDEYEIDKSFYKTPGQASLHWKYNDNNHLLFRVRANDLGGQNTNFLWGGTLGSPFLSPAGMVDMIGVSGYNAYRDGQMLNVAWARPMDSGGAFSIGVLFADSGEKDNDDPEWNNESTAFGAQVTWGNGNGFDLAGSFHMEGSTYDPGDDAVESDFTHFDLTARMERDNGWIYQFGAIVGSGSVDDEGDVSAMGLMGNVGRFLLDTSDGAVTSEFFVNYFNVKYEPEGDGEYNEGYLTVPGMRVAAWHQISRRFQVLGGASAFWTSSKWEETNGETYEYKERGMTFSYSGGLAFTPTDNFRIEGELQMNALNQLLSLGNTQPLLTRVGGTFTF